MLGEEEERLGSTAQLLTIATGTPSGKENPRTNHEAGGPGKLLPTTTSSGGIVGSSGAFGLPKSTTTVTLPPLPPSIPPPSKISHHAEIEETETPCSTDSGGSRLELELQFAGVDNETVELDEVECNYGGVFGSGNNRRSTSPVGLHPGIGGSSSRTDTNHRGTESGHQEEEEEEAKETKPPDPPSLIPETLVQKCQFYTTAFFILLAVFSLFSFLFLVPFVIDPAFTTIFNEFDPEPAFCRTKSIVNVYGVQCRDGWTSCREGCTKDVYNCTQILVEYRTTASLQQLDHPSSSSLSSQQQQQQQHFSLQSKSHHYGSSGDSSNNFISYFNYNHDGAHKKKKHRGNGGGGGGSGGSEGYYRGNSGTSPSPMSSTSNDVWFPKAHLHPNVKGCGYPPSVNCSIFLSKYAHEGRNFSCYYSKVKPWLVVTSFNMDHLILELALSMAIPIPCFIVSVIYLVFAYFKIYNNNTSSTATTTTTTTTTTDTTTAQVPPSSTPPPTTNNNGPSPSPEPPVTALSSLVDEKARALRRSSSRTLNALTEKLLPNSKTHPPLEMNDLTPIISRNSKEEHQIHKNNRLPERNGPTNPPAKNKGDSLVVVDIGCFSQETTLSVKRFDEDPPPVILMPPPTSTTCPATATTSSSTVVVATSSSFLNSSTTNEIQSSLKTPIVTVKKEENGTASSSPKRKSKRNETGGGGR